ncbi:MAG: O-Antigen ligase [Gaiellaceae bacterium]|nr:O-Antigen ligase [Gaiellaceae bacterium]
MRTRYVWFVLALVVANGAVAYFLATGSLRRATAITLAPIMVICLAALVASDRSVLLYGALALPLTFSYANEAVAFGSMNVFAADILLALALGSWLAAKLLAGRPSALADLRRKRVIGVVPLVAFAIAVSFAVVRGHIEYGQTLAGQPIRLIAYVCIACAIVDVTVEKAHRGITAVLYAAVGWQVLVAGYHIATGTSQSDVASLSTGGHRYVSVSVSLCIALALFLALLNLASARTARAQLVHATAAVFSLVLAILSFTRGTMIAVALVGLVFMLVVPGLTRRVAALLPLALPIIAIILITAPRLAPTGVPDELRDTLISRLDPSLANDLSVRWRQEATAALWEQFREEPVLGVGFGKKLVFEVAGVVYREDQEAHNDAMYILAATGVVGLAAIAAVVGSLMWFALARLRTAATTPERILVTWSIAGAFTFVANSLVEPLVGIPSLLLVLWVLLLIPVAIPGSTSVAAEPSTSPGRLPRSLRLESRRLPQVADSR